MNDRNRIPGHKLWSLIFIQAKYKFSVATIRTLYRRTCVISYAFLFISHSKHTHTQRVHLFHTLDTVQENEMKRTYTSSNGFLYEKQTTNTQMKTENKNRNRSHHYYSRCLFVKHRPVYWHSFHSHTYLHTHTHTQARNVYATMLIWIHSIIYGQGLKHFIGWRISLALCKCYWISTLPMYHSLIYTHHLKIISYFQYL